eukprot:gene6309-8689_t
MENLILAASQQKPLMDNLTASSSSSSSVDLQFSKSICTVPAIVPDEQFPKNSCMDGKTDTTQSKSTCRLTSEERNSILNKIKSGYRKKAQTYEELLEICSAIEENLIYDYAPSKLDYFKTGIRCVGRINEKKIQIESMKERISKNDRCTDSNEENTNDDIPKPVKRSKNTI